MSKVFDEIVREASQLSREQRFHLAGLLLELDEDSRETSTSAEWEQEILARIRAVDEGEVTGISLEKVMHDAEERLTS
jgi:hypothetical protein